MVLNHTVTISLESLVPAALFTGGLYFFWMRPAFLGEKKRCDTAISQAERAAEISINAAKLESKEEALRVREKIEQELKPREEKLASREDSLEARRESLQERESYLHSEQRALAEHRTAVEKRATVIQEELQRVARLTKDQARERLLTSLEQECRAEAIRRGADFERTIFEESEKKARKILLDVIQRQAVTTVSEATLSVINLPSDDMKGRIIGREGRNIKAFETITGVDVIIDETPESITLSSFDPVRRETARLAMLNLIIDGRIHPNRIEELYEEAKQEVQRVVRESGEEASERARVGGLHPRVIETMGRLKFRASYAQNVLDHSVEVARIAAQLAYELGLNADVARRAGFLHDIGKALGEEFVGPHALTGMEFIRGFDEKEPVLNAVGAHHNEIEPATPEAHLVIVADAISAARPGARNQNLDSYIKRLTDLEELANQFEGVEKSYAIQAGRELRLVVKSDEIDDLAAKKLATAVAKKISSTSDAYGQVRVTVIRETRYQEVSQ